MLKNFWYACEFSHAVTSQPKQIELWNQKIVLYRDAAGHVVALKDQCPHRGAALSLGKVENGCISCPYHGWQFQPSGLCSKIPSNPPHIPIPKQARINRYPTQEKYGFIWLLWGEGTPETCPPLPVFDVFPSTGFRPVYFELTFKAHYSRVLENLVDPIHVSFMHGDTFGSGQDPYLLGKDRAVLEDWGAHISQVVVQPLSKPLQFVLRKEKLETKLKMGFHLPNITFIAIDFQFQTRSFLAMVPVNDSTTLLKTIQFRNFLTHPWADGLSQKFGERTLQEDMLVIESQVPRAVPNQLFEEINVAGDSMAIAYRRLRQKSMGDTK